MTESVWEVVPCAWTGNSEGAVIQCRLAACIILPAALCYTQYIIDLFIFFL